MTIEEVKQAYEESGMSPEDIATALGKAFENGDIDKDQLGALLEADGFKLKPEFASMSDEEAKGKLWGDGEDVPEDDKAEAEDDEKASEDDSEDDDRKEALKLMNLD